MLISISDSHTNNYATPGAYEHLKDEMKRENAEWKLEMQCHLGGLHTQSPTELPVVAARGVALSLFTDDIMAEVKSKKFKPLEFKMFEGKEDPV